MAMIDDAANLVERVVYDAYGRARHQWPEDVDGDGDVDSADDAIMDALSGSFPIAITSGSYNADADIDRDGDVDSDDAQAVTDALTTAALAFGQISDPAGPDNPIGYDGYVFNATDGTYTVRFRTYFPEMGRWGEKDPIDYMGGSIVLYEFMGASPLSQLDPMGLDFGNLTPGERRALPHYYDRPPSCEFTVRAPTDPGPGWIVGGERYGSLEESLLALRNRRAALRRSGRDLDVVVIQSHGYPGHLAFPIAIGSKEELTLELLQEIEFALCDPCSITDTRRDELNYYLSVLDELFSIAPRIDVFACNVGRSEYLPNRPQFGTGRGPDFIARLRSLRIMDPATEVTFHLGYVFIRDFVRRDYSGNPWEAFCRGDMTMTLCGVSSGRVQIPDCECPSKFSGVVQTIKAGMRAGACASAVPAGN
ncbi:MAG: hypothetical protein H6811_03850 [Phycisphaeraceae bacterium]|nr:hypothetical protein [Phycisphaeraceae bacterium]